MHKKILIGMFLVACLVALTDPANAQQDPQKWSFRLTPYLVGTGMAGDITIQGLPAAVDASFGDILENLEFGAMLNFVATLGPASFTVDFIYMGLGGSADKPAAEIDVNQWMGELDAAYQINPWLGALVGLRGNSLSGDIQVQGKREKEESGIQLWIDPVVGTRLTVQVAERWTLRGRGDIGGFGVGSRLTWQLAAYVDFRASDLIAIVGGYRWLYMDYETGSANDQFRYTMTISGPALGVSFVL